jgi:hypothetical protein
MNYIYLIKLSSPIGLILDIIGAILIYKYGLPEEVSRSGTTVIIMEQEDEDEKLKALKYDKYSRKGFWSLIMGFIFQLISSIYYNFNL